MGLGSLLGCCARRPACRSTCICDTAPIPFPSKIRNACHMFGTLLAVHVCALRGEWLQSTGWAAPGSTSARCPLEPATWTVCVTDMRLKAVDKDIRTGVQRATVRFRQSHVALYCTTVGVPSRSSRPHARPQTTNADQLSTLLNRGFRSRSMETIAACSASAASPAASPSQRS